MIVIIFTFGHDFAQLFPQCIALCSLYLTPWTLRNIYNIIRPSGLGADIFLPHRPSVFCAMSTHGRCKLASG